MVGILVERFHDPFGHRSATNKIVTASDDVQNLKTHARNKMVKKIRKRPGVEEENTTYVVLVWDVTGKLLNGWHYHDFTDKSQVRADGQLREEEIPTQELSFYSCF